MREIDGFASHLLNQADGPALAGGSNEEGVPSHLPRGSNTCYFRIMDIEQELTAIQERNQRVEADKAWEVSWTRRVFIALATYIIASIWLVVIHDSMPFLKALVPTVGYVLSTLSLPFIKQWWISSRPPLIGKGRSGGDIDL